MCVRAYGVRRNVNARQSEKVTCTDEKPIPLTQIGDDFLLLFQFRYRRKNIYFDFNVCSNEYKPVKVQESNRIVYTNTITRRPFCRRGHLNIIFSEIFIWNQFSRLDFLLFPMLVPLEQKIAFASKVRSGVQSLSTAVRAIFVSCPLRFMRTCLDDSGFRVERWGTNRVWVGTSCTTNIKLTNKFSIFDKSAVYAH